MGCNDRVGGGRVLMCRGLGGTVTSTKPACCKGSWSAHGLSTGAKLCWPAKQPPDTKPDSSLAQPPISNAIVISSVAGQHSQSPSGLYVLPSCQCR